MRFIKQKEDEDRQDIDYVEDELDWFAHNWVILINNRTIAYALILLAKLNLGRFTKDMLNEDKLVEEHTEKWNLCRNEETHKWLDMWPEGETVMLVYLPHELH